MTIKINNDELCPTWYKVWYSARGDRNDMSSNLNAQMNELWIEVARFVDWQVWFKLDECMRDE